MQPTTVITPINAMIAGSMQPLDSFHVIHEVSPIPPPFETVRRKSKPILAKLGPQQQPSPQPIFTTTEQKIESPPISPRQNHTDQVMIEDPVERTTRRRSENVSFSLPPSPVDAATTRKLSIKPTNAAAEEGKIRRASRKSIKWAPEEALVLETQVKQTHHQIVQAEIERQERRKNLFFCCFPGGLKKKSVGGGEDYYV